MIRSSLVHCQSPVCARAIIVELFAVEQAIFLGLERQDLRFFANAKAIRGRLKTKCNRNDNVIYIYGYLFGFFPLAAVNDITQLLEFLSGVLGDLRTQRAGVAERDIFVIFVETLFGHIVV